VRIRFQIMAPAGAAARAAADVDSLVESMGSTPPEALSRIVATLGATVDEDWLVLVLAKAFERDVAAGNVGRSPSRGGLFTAALQGLVALDALQRPHGDNLRPLALALEVATRGDAPSVMGVLLRWDFANLHDLGVRHAEATSLMPSTPEAGARLAPWARGLARFLVDHDALGCAEHVLAKGSALAPAVRIHTIHVLARSRMTAAAVAAAASLTDDGDLLHGVRHRWVRACAASGRPEVVEGGDGWIFSLGLALLGKPELVVRVPSEASAEERARVKRALQPLIEALMCDRPERVALPRDPNQEEAPCCTAIRDVVAPWAEGAVVFVRV